MKIHVGNRNCFLETEDLEILKALDSIYVESYPGAYYVTKKTPGWDGKKHFFSIHIGKDIKGGKFQTGLLPQILKNLDNANLKYEIEYAQTPCIADYKPDMLEGFSLFSDQEELILRLNERALCVSPTGSGKSIIMAYLTSLYLDKYPNKMVLVVTQRKQLVHQLYKFFSSIFQGVGICSGSDFVPGRKVNIVSIGSFEKLLNQSLDVSLVLVDEIHEFAGGKKSLAKIAQVDCYQKFGFTATLPTDRYSLLTLEGVFGPVVKGETTQQLTAKGRIPIAEVNIYTFKHAEYRSKNSYLETYKEKIVKNRERNALLSSICDRIIHTDRNAKILLLVRELDHIEELKKLLPKAISIQGSDSIDERYRKIKLFIEDRNVIIGTNVMQTGINIPELTDLINARCLKSEIPTLQAVGRMLRGKHLVTVHDIRDDCKYLDEHFENRLEAYKEEGHKINEVTI